MLKLRDFLHLPQLDSLFSQLISDEPGLIVLAGIDVRPVQFGRSGPSTTTLPSSDSFTPSGLSAFFNILIQEILLAHPLSNALIVSTDRSLARVPRQLKRRVGFLEVESPEDYPRQIQMATGQRPGLLVIDHLNQKPPRRLFSSRERCARVDPDGYYPARGAVARQMVDMGVPRTS